jgi:hypothetical protein
MAKKPVVVTEAEWEKDKENVQRIETPIPGFADAEPVITYVQVQYLDDVTEKPADGIETVPLLVPVEKEKEEVVIGEDGEPEKNEDGSDKLQAVKYWDFEPREIDLGSASLKKLVTALKPFYEKSRPRVVSVSRPASASKAPGSAGHDLAAIREWAKKAGHEVADKGRIPNKVIDAYYNATGKSRPDGQQSF